MYDLHLHSTYSDGDTTVQELAAAVASRGMRGFALTDHHGIWGGAEARTAAAALNLAYVSGLEINAHSEAVQLHVLGYAHQFKADIIQAGLAPLRAEYARRLEAMVDLCSKAGYSGVSLEAIQQSRVSQQQPFWPTYDVAKQLQQAGVPAREAQRQTVRGGSFYVELNPKEVLTVAQVVALIASAGGVAVVAHPGIIAHEYGEPTMWEVLRAAVESGAGGLEVYHPFHSPKLTGEFARFAADHKLVATGGSDWHGPGRYHNEAFGRIGTPSSNWQQLQNVLDGRE